MDDSIKIDGFQKIEKIVDGSYWRLFRAERIKSGTWHVLQVLDESSSKDAELVALFKKMREMKHVLHHDAILTPVDYDETSRYKFLLYEDFEATSLKAEIDSQNLPCEEQAKSVIRQIAEALQFAQIRGVRHGWVLPEVILRSSTDNAVKMIGFGSEGIFTHLYDKKPDIASLLNPYIPPEQLGQAEPPLPDDCYALGVLFYYVLSGEIPYEGASVAEIKQQKMAALPVNKLNEKTSPLIVELVTSLVDPKPFRRATYSSLLSELNPQEDTDIVLDQPPSEHENGFSKVRDLVSDINPLNKNKLSGQAKAAYISALVVFILVLFLGVFIVARLSLNEKNRMQHIYDEYLAEQRYEKMNESSSSDWEQTEPVSPLEDDLITNDHERNSPPADTLESALETRLDQPEVVPDPSEIEENSDVALKTDLVISVSAESKNVTAEIFVDGQRYGYSNTEGMCTISDLLVNKTYRIRVVRDDWQVWERSVSIKDGENYLDIELQPHVAELPSFTFLAVPFADQIKVNDEIVARNLPCTIKAPPGKLNVTYIDSKAEFSWRTSFDLNENESTLSVSAEQVGKGDIVIVLNDPIQYGYAFVKVDDQEEPQTTPFRASLNAGWHHVQIFRENYTISPADTSIFVRPGVKLNIRCTVL